MVYPATPQIGLGLPTTYAHSHMPTRDFSPYSTQSVRLNVPHIPHLDTPSSPFPDNQISVDVGSWSRDVGLSIRTESSPSSSIFDPSPDYVEDSVLDTDSDRSPVLSPSNSEYQLDVDYPRLMFPSTSDDNLEINPTPRASDRFNHPIRQPSSAPHIELDSPSHYSDATTICHRSAPDVNDTPSIPNTERIITPLPDTSIDTAQDTDLRETDLGTSRNGLDPNSKSFVPTQSQDTARRIIRYDRTTGEYTYIDGPISEHLRRQYQTTLPHASQNSSTNRGQSPLEVARGPPVVPTTHPRGPPPNPPPGFQYNLPPGLPLNCHPVQYGPPPGLPFNPSPRFRPGPPPGVPANIPPRFQPGPPPGLPANIPPRFQPGPPPGLPANIPPRFHPNPPPGFPPRPYVEPQHHVNKTVDKPVSCDPYLDFEHVVPKYIKRYSSGHVDIHPHHLDRFIPREQRISTPPIKIEKPISPLPISIEEPRSPLPLPAPEPISPASPGPPSKTIYMIRAGKGRSSFFEAKARALHLPHCLDIPIGILRYNSSLSEHGKRQVEDLCKQTVSNIQARAQLLVTSPQRRALRTTAALFPLCRRLFKPNMVPVSRPIKALGLLNDTRPKPSVPLDLLAALCPDPRSQLYFGLKFDYTQINVFSSTSRNSTEDPLKEVRERAKVMRQWLWDRPETVIVVVSHNDFMHHMVDFGERHTKWDYCQIREFTMFDGVEGYGPSLAEVPLDLSGPPREAPKCLLERIEERKMMCHVEESC